MQVIITLIYLTISTIAPVQPPTASQVLAKSIAFHDPSNQWPELKARFTLEEIREAETRETKFLIDNNIGKFQFERGNDIHGMVIDSCYVISGTSDCDRVANVRNFYLYLWGLPMKLNDTGTDLQPEAKTVDFRGVQAYQVDVHYDNENWSFFIDQTTYALLGYQFYFNQKEGGELITLTGIVEHAGIKFPKERIWYELPGESYLAKDILVGIESSRK